MNIVHPEFSASVFEVLGQTESDITDALDGHFQAGEVVAAEPVFYSCFEANKGAVGGNRRRVSVTGVAIESGAVGNAGHMAGMAPHHFQIRHAGAGVFGRNVMASQAFQVLAHSLQQGLCFVLARIANNHGFATTQVQIGQGRFVGHAPGQAKHISQRFFITGVREHSATA